MNRTRFGALEVIARAPAEGHARETPLLFIHGAYTGAWCWDEHFLGHFAGLGYCSYALSLSGHGKSRRGVYLDGLSLADYVRDVAEVVAGLPAPPVLIGHSMGGMVVQKYLEREAVPGAVLMASVPPQGLLGSAFGLAFARPGMFADLNRLMGGGHPDPQTLRQALFHQPVERERLARYARLCQPESHRALWDMSLFDLPSPLRRHTVPVMVLGGQYDVLIPPEQVRFTAHGFGVEAHVVPDIGHGMMLERNWQEAAAPLADWLAAQGF